MSAAKNTAGLPKRTARHSLRAATGSAETDLRKGLWFQATCSGMWYHNPNAAGEINAIMVNGRLFGPQNK
jgi:hypothetical protein